MRSVINAVGDAITGEITIYERARSGAIARRSMRGEFVSYLAKSDVSADLLHALRSSRNVAGLVQEGSWYRIAWRTRQAREDACDPEHGWFAKQDPPIATYEADVSPMRRWMADHAIAIEKPKRVYLDIETCARVSMAEKEKSRILCWTLAVEKDADHATVVAQGCLTADDDRAEAALLRRLWEALADYDQVLAWNGDNFDFPVIFARTRKHQIPIDVHRWLWLDHLELFRRMNVSAAESGDEKQSLSLQAVAMSVLKVGKLEGVGWRDIFSMWDAGGDLRQRLLEYNARDVELMCRIEARTGYVELLRTLCEVTGVFADTRGIQPMPQVEAFMLRLARERDVHFKTRTRFHEENADAAFKGAFVMDPKVKGIVRDVHVADFSSMYPSIVLSFNMSPDTLVVEARDAWLDRLANRGPHYLQTNKSLELEPEPIPEGCVRAPFTGALFSLKTKGILVQAIEFLLDMRKEWSAKQATLPPGTTEWVEAGRRSTAYKIAANSFFGVVGAKVSRLYQQEVAESITQTGAWLIGETIKAAAGEPWKLNVVYGDTDSIFVIGCTVERFREFVAWCNDVLYPRLIAAQGCQRNTIKIAYEKAFDRIVFVTAKRYAGRYLHYKGKPATEDSKPEIKGLEYKRGDAPRLARRLQAEVIDLLLGGGVEVPAGFGEPMRRSQRGETCVDSVDPFVALIEQYQARILRGDLPLEDVVMSKKLTKSVREYASKTKQDGTEAAQPPHVRVAKILIERGEDVRPGARIEYVVVDGSSKPAKIIPASDWTGECDRFELWEAYVWPPTERLLAAAFPAALWGAYGRVRPVKARGARLATAASFPAPTGDRTQADRSGAEPPAQTTLFSLGDAQTAPLTGRGTKPRRRTR